MQLDELTFKDLIGMDKHTINIIKKAILKPKQSKERSKFLSLDKKINT